MQSETQPNHDEATRSSLDWLHRSKNLSFQIRLTSDLFRFWGRGVKSASNTSLKRFVEAFRHYTDAVVEQAKDRHHRYIRNIDDYFDVRRLTIELTRHMQC